MHRLIITLLLSATLTAQALEIYSTSFETPVVTGRVTTKPDGWVGGSYGTRREGLENVDSGTFSTTYGSQAACIWSNSSETVLTTAEATFGDILVAGVTYTITCNVAKPTDLSGYYKIQLMAFPAGARRDSFRDTDYGAAKLAQVTGTATNSDMSETVRLDFTPDASNPNLGRMLAVRIGNPSMCVVDNLTFSDDGDGSDIAPPQLWSRYPRDGSTSMGLSYGFELTFNEAVTNGTGNITVYDASDDSIVETIDVATSGQVSINSNLVTVTRNVVLKNDTAYYVLIDNTAFPDLAANAYAGITANTGWNFTTPVADGTELIYYTSFESPVVSNRVLTLPDGWVGGNYGSQQQAIENENSGTYTTPWGSQAVATGGNQDPLTTAETTIEAVLQSGFPYTVTFNVALPTNAVANTYKVELIAFDPGDARNDIYNSTRGEILATASGSASLPDMSAQAVGFTYTADTDSVSLGRLLAIEIDQSTRCLIDNLKLTWVPPPPAGTVLIIR